MLEGGLRVLVGLLALAGGLALLTRGTRSAARLALQTAEITALEGMIEISERRGDLTGMSERREQERRLRAGRRGDLLQTLGWALWFVVPIAAGWLPGAFALAAPLWLLPLRPVREGKG